MFKIKTFLIIFSGLIAGCATDPGIAMSDISDANPTSNVPSIDHLSAVRAAGEKCLVHMDRTVSQQTCPVQPETFDRAACIAFDDAIQSALRPIQACARSGHFTSGSAKSSECSAYLDAFLQPCVGGHALQITYRDMEKSRAYRDAIANGMSKDEARALHLADIIRYRD